MLAARSRRTALAVLTASVLVVASSCSDDGADSGATDAPVSEAPVTDAPTTEAPATDAPVTEAPTTVAPEASTWSGVAPNMTPVDEATAAEWQALFEGALSDASGVPGVWVAISHPELGYWSAALGDAVAGSQPATLDDHGRIGSVTKTFTATAVLELVDAGSLSLDDTVADLVPDLAAQFPDTADLTVEQLLSMESGLPDYANLPGAATAQAIADPTKIWTPEDLIQAALDAAPVDPPGTPGYSTTNYTILGRILEAVTGQPVEQVLTELAASVGLDQTALLPGDQNALPDPSSHGYIDDNAVEDLASIGATVAPGTDVTDWSMSWGGAGGGMYSVIDQLFSWTATAMGTTSLSPALAEQRLTFDTSIYDQGIDYSLGLFQLMNVEDWVGHTGQAVGWESFGLYDPSTGATIAVMLNGTSGSSPFVRAWATIFDIPLG